MADETLRPSAFDGDRYQRRTVTGDSSSTAHRVLHKLLEAREPNRFHRAVLEVGANRGEHLPYVLHAWNEYVMLDLALPGDDVLARFPRGARFEVGDAESLPFADSAFDRTLMTCVLHHLRDPELALNELRRVTRRGGRVNVLLPSDPGLVYRLVRLATSGRRARRDGMAAEEQLWHAREHRNHVASLLTMAKEVFRTDAVSVTHFPTGLPTWNLNLVSVLRVDRR